MQDFFGSDRSMQPRFVRTKLRKNSMQNVALKGQGAEQTLPNRLFENAKVHPRIRVCMYIDEHKNHDDLSHISICSFGNCASYCIYKLFGKGGPADAKAFPKNVPMSSLNRPKIVTWR